jgi:hypothetical protein
MTLRSAISFSCAQSLLNSSGRTATFLAALLIAACGGGGASSGGQGSGGVALTEQQRQAVLDAVSAQATQVAQQGGDFAAGMTQYLLSRPELTQVGTAADGSVSAHFTDGELLVVANNHPLGGPIAATPAGATRSDRARAAAIAMPAASNKAVISEGFGGGDPDTTALTSQLSQWLNDAGYVAVALPAVSVAELRTYVKGVDVFVHTGHGGLSEEGFFVVTAAYPPPSTRTDEDKADFQAGRLGYLIESIGTDAKGNQVKGAYWGITGAFVSTYMSFNPGSLVVINTCNGASGASLDLGFRKAFASAGSYLGWTNTTNAIGNDRIRYVFDRMLGELPGGGGRESVIAQESPPQRAFDLDSTLKDMSSQTPPLIPLVPNASAGTSATGNLVNLGPGDAILAPSIAVLGTDELNNLLYIEGIFDEKQTGTVSVDGQDCPVQSWGAVTVTCTLARTGPGSEGDVVVTVNGVKSNVVSLSAWNGTFTYSVAGEQSIEAAATMNMHWRADIHKWRRTPHTDPTRYRRPVYAIGDSNAMISASGSASEPLPDGTTLTLGISAGLSLPVLSGAGSVSAAPPWFSAGVLLDGDTGQGWIDFSIVTNKNVISTSGNACTGPFEFGMEDILLFQRTTWPQLGPDGTVIGTQPWLGIPVSVDTADYAVLAPPQPYSDSSSLGCPYAISSGYTWTLNWPQITPSHSPDPNAAQ